MPKLVCRLCLQTVNGQKYYDVNTVETNSGFMPFRDQITTCIPEVAIDLVPESLICTACAESLKTAYEFKTKCLQVEERIRTYFDMKEDKSNYDLSDLVIESVTCDIYKKETEEDDGYDPLQIKVKEEVIEIKEEKSTTKIVCSTCGQVFKNHAEWKHHDHFHVSPTQFTCNFCKEGFASLQCLRRHNSTCVQSGKPTKDTILTKRPHLPCQAKNHLTEWLFNHQHHPYPTDTEKQILMQETNLTLLQVENWFINARRRVLQDFSRRKKYSRLKM